MHSYIYSLSPRARETRAQSETTHTISLKALSMCICFSLDFASAVHTEFALRSVFTLVCVTGLFFTQLCNGEVTKHFLWNFMWGFEDRIGTFPLSTAPRHVNSHIKESSIFNPCFMQILGLHFLNRMDVWCGLYLYFLSMQKASLCECEGNKHSEFTSVCLSSASVPRFPTEIYLNTCTPLVGKHFLTLTRFLIF